MPHTYPYPRPGLTVDAVIVTEGVDPQVLLIRRKNEPYKGSWALPGGFVDEGETLDTAAARELKEETGLEAGQAQLSQVAAFGDPGRDPRGWCVSVAYAALIPSTAHVEGADDAEEAKVLRVSFRHLAARQGTDAGLAAALDAGAQGLEGPWQHAAST